MDEINRYSFKHFHHYEKILNSNLNPSEPFFGALKFHVFILIKKIQKSKFINGSKFSALISRGEFHPVKYSSSHLTGGKITEVKN